MERNKTREKTQSYVSTHYYGNQIFDKVICVCMSVCVRACTCLRVCVKRHHLSQMTMEKLRYPHAENTILYIMSRIF